MERAIKLRDLVTIREDPELGPWWQTRKSAEDDDACRCGAAGY
jgi:hypothetical protein